MTTSLQLEQVTDAQLERYAELIYDTAGIRISPQKKTMLSNRLRRRLKANRLTDFDEYLELLKRRPNDDPEWDAFLQEVSTHETFLFRDDGHWTWFQSEYLPEIVAAARAGTRRKTLRVWSAACSTGDEAFTIATCIAAGISNRDQWKIEIVGTDIGIGAVREAERAEFNERSMKLVPESMRRRYFDALPGKHEMWKAKPMLSAWTSFRQHNLLDTFREKPFDLIFIKNVLIYFDVAAKKRALANILPLLAPGGVLVTAAAEGVSGIINDFERIKPWLYRKPGKPTKP
jgi:chemotaxis protein methyltransferase CheR